MKWLSSKGIEGEDLFNRLIGNSNVMKVFAELAESLEFEEGCTAAEVGEVLGRILDQNSVDEVLHKALGGQVLNQARFAKLWMKILPGLKSQDDAKKLSALGLKLKELKRHANAGKRKLEFSLVDAGIDLGDAGVPKFDLSTTTELRAKVNIEGPVDAPRNLTEAGPELEPIVCVGLQGELTGAVSGAASYSVVALEIGVGAKRKADLEVYVRADWDTRYATAVSEGIRALTRRSFLRIDQLSALL